MTRGKWAVDIGIALLLVVVGLVEVWLPMESVYGDGSPVISTLGILVFNALLSQRRARPWVALSALLVWPLLGLSQGGSFQVMFFGQLVPLMVLVFSLARFAQGPLRWIGPMCGLVFVAIADLFMPMLRSPNELIFHWGNIILAFLLGLALRISAERAAAEAIRATVAESTAREQALLAVSEERARIARELHDIVAHSVSVMVVQAGAAEQMVADDPAYARRALGTIRTTGSGALAEMRRLVTMLRDPESDADLAPQPGVGSLTDLITAAEGAGFHVELEVTGDRPDLPAGLDLTVYRIVQEALTNVRRHSLARQARVGLDFGSEALEIVVTDPGPARGSGSPGSGSAGSGHGLVGMRERVALFGGKVSAEAAGDGFEVRAVVPLERVG